MTPKRRKLLDEKKRRKLAQMMKPGEESNYAKKREWLRIHGGWGWEYPDKPWR